MSSVWLFSIGFFMMFEKCQTVMEVSAYQLHAVGSGSNVLPASNLLNQLYQKQVLEGRRNADFGYDQQQLEEFYEKWQYLHDAGDPESWVKELDVWQNGSRLASVGYVGEMESLATSLLNKHFRYEINGGNGLRLEKAMQSVVEEFGRPGYKAMFGEHGQDNRYPSLHLEEETIRLSDNMPWLKKMSNKAALSDSVASNKLTSPATDAKITVNNSNHLTERPSDIAAIRQSGLHTLEIEGPSTHTLEVEGSHGTGTSASVFSRMFGRRRASVTRTPRSPSPPVEGRKTTRGRGFMGRRL